MKIPDKWVSGVIYGVFKRLDAVLLVTCLVIIARIKGIQAIVYFMATIAKV